MLYFPNCSLDVVTNNVHEVNTCTVLHLHCIALLYRSSEWRSVTCN